MNLFYHERAGSDANAFLAVIASTANEKEIF